VAWGAVDLKSGGENILGRHEGHRYIVYSRDKSYGSCHVCMYLDLEYLLLFSIWLIKLPIYRATFMSRPTPSRSTLKVPGRNASHPPLTSLSTSPKTARSRAATPKTAHAQRTTKTSQKLVVLPSDPQTKLLRVDNEDPHHGYETDNGVREYKSSAERMNKEQRKQAGYKRITAYCLAEGFNMKLLTSFLKREHNVIPRVFDEAVYTVSRSHTVLYQLYIRVDVPLAAFTRLQSKYQHPFFGPFKTVRRQISPFQIIRS
jgi:hypothetical protein